MRRYPKGTYASTKHLADGTLKVYYNLRHYGALKAASG